MLIVGAIFAAFIIGKRRAQARAANEANEGAGLDNDAYAAWQQKPLPQGMRQWQQSKPATYHELDTGSPQIPEMAYRRERAELGPGR